MSTKITKTNKTMGLANTYSNNRRTPSHSELGSSNLPLRANISQRSSACPCGGGCPRCASIQAKSQPGESNPVAPGIQERIRSLQGGGEPLTPNLRGFFEPRLGRDLSEVRLHTGGQAAETAKALNTRAFTVGKDIVFGAGQYTPVSGQGKTLLAHELVHVLQQENCTQSTVIHRQEDETGDISSHRRSREEEQSVPRETLEALPNSHFRQDDSDDISENILKNGAIVYRYLNFVLNSIKAKLKKDRIDFFNIVADGLLWNTEAERNTRQILLTNPEWFHFMIPLWNAYEITEEQHKMNKGWWLIDDVAGSFYRSQLKITDLGEWDTNTKQMNLAVTHTWMLRGPVGRVKYFGFDADDLIKRVVHEMQHRLDRDTYHDVDFDWEYDFIRFRREYRARSVAQQPVKPCFVGDEEGSICVKDIISSTGKPLDPNREDHGVLFTVLGLNSSITNPDINLIKVYQSNLRFRKACDDFALAYEKSPALLSFNPYNSPRLDNLYNLVKRYWKPVELPWHERPWGKIEATLKTFTERDLEVLTESNLWKEYIDRHMQEDASEFWHKAFHLTEYSSQ